MDYDLGVLLLNFIADFWDLKDQYDLLHPLESESNTVVKRSASPNVGRWHPRRPSCSVLIKHINETNDILFAHNTWHEYRAMGYRYVEYFNS